MTPKDRGWYGLTQAESVCIYLSSQGKQWGSTHSRGLVDPGCQRAQTPVQRFGRGSAWSGGPAAQTRAGIHTNSPIYLLDEGIRH